MRFKTSKTVIVFASITGACALLGGVAQVSQNLNSSRLESQRSKSLTTIAQHTLSNTCRRSDGGAFQKYQVIEEPGGLTPTSCYQNELGERAFVAYEGGKLVTKEVFSATEVNARISEIKGEKKK